MDNFHGSCIILGDAGVVIAGASGSGKTALAISLIDRATQAGKFAVLVSDDQVLLSATNGRLVCRVPDTIAGKIELRGYGIAHIDHEAACTVGLWVQLLPAEEVERIPERAEVERLGVKLPVMTLPANHTAENTHAILMQHRSSAASV